MTKKLSISALFIALGVLTSNLIYIPVGISRCFPVQHAINVLGSVSLGPKYAVSIAFLISLIRNILGTGSILAFPGSMIGALLSSLLYQKTNKLVYAVLGEIVGTGLIGGLLCFPISKFLLGKEVGAFFFIIPFIVSTIGGSLIAYFLCSNSIVGKLLKEHSHKNA